MGFPVILTIPHVAIIPCHSLALVLACACVTYHPSVSDSWRTCLWDWTALASVFSHLSGAETPQWAVGLCHRGTLICWASGRHKSRGGLFSLEKLCDSFQSAKWSPNKPQVKISVQYPFRSIVTLSLKHHGSYFYSSQAACTQTDTAALKKQ